jgi:hypothetical protein
MYRGFFDLDQGSTVLKFRLQPDSLQRINSIAIRAAAQITVPMEFSVATSTVRSVHNDEWRG